MNKVLKNYLPTLLLLAGILIGGVCGVAFGPKAQVVGPVGTLFLNFIFVLIVPLVFFSVVSSVCKLVQSGSFGRVFLNIVLVFLGMSLVAGLLGYFGCVLFDPLAGVDKSAIMANLPARSEGQSMSFGEAIVSAISVPDFLQLFSRDHLLPLIIFSAVMGWAIGVLGKAAEPVAKLVDSGLELVMEMMNMLMTLAPIGLGCYFADIVASMGSQLIGGYFRAFLLYTVIAAIIFFILNPLYVVMAKGPKGFGLYWKHILPPSLTAIATASSAAAMPGNIEAAKRMGVNPTIAESVVPLGTNMHKDGTVLGEIIKIIFLMGLYGQACDSVGTLVVLLAISLLSAMVMGAVPSGGATGEILICSLMGFSPEMVGVIFIISNLIDIPATLANSSSNVSAALLVDRLSTNDSYQSQ